jgi:HEAT repeat protein
MSDRSPNVRFEAAWALGEMGPAAAEAVPALEKAVHDVEPTVREAVGYALDRIRK